MAKTKEEKEEEKVSKQVYARYKTRLTFLKNGKEYFKNMDFVNASRSYLTYLNLIAEYKGTQEKKMTVNHFDKTQELAEMMLISHTYWDLAKIYDRTPRLNKELDRALNQFVNFTLGNKFQTPNYGMIKRYLKRGKLVNKKSFELALKRLEVAKKTCMVSTYAYGHNHLITKDLRAFRELIYPTTIGKAFVDLYYFISPLFLSIITKNKYLSSFVKHLVVRPLIRVFHRTIK